MRCFVERCGNKAHVKARERRELLPVEGAEDGGPLVDEVVLGHAAGVGHVPGCGVGAGYGWVGVGAGVAHTAHAHIMLCASAEAGRGGSCGASGGARL